MYPKIKHEVLSVIYNWLYVVHSLSSSTCTCIMGAGADRQHPTVFVSAVVLSRGLVSTAGAAAALAPPTPAAAAAAAGRGAALLGGRIQVG